MLEEFRKSPVGLGPRETRAAGLAVADRLDAQPVGLVDLAFQPRDAAGILRLPRPEEFGVGGHVGIVARRPGKPLVVVGVALLVGPHQCGELFGLDRLRVLPTVASRDPDAVDVATHAGELPADVDLAVAVEQSNAEFVAHLGRAIQHALEGQRERLAGGERHRLLGDRAGGVGLGDHLDHGAVVAAAGRDERGGAPHGLVGKVVDLVEFDRRHDRIGGPHGADLDPVDRQPQRVDRNPVDRRILLELKLIVFHARLVREQRFGVAGGDAGDLVFLFFALVTSHAIEAAAGGGRDADRRAASGMCDAERERLVAPLGIERDRTERPLLSACLDRDREAVHER